MARDIFILESGGEKLTFSGADLRLERDGETVFISQPRAARPGEGIYMQAPRETVGVFCRPRLAFYVEPNAEKENLQAGAYMVGAKGPRGT